MQFIVHFNWFVPSPRFDVLWVCWESGEGILAFSGLCVGCKRKLADYTEVVVRNCRWQMITEVVYFVS